jgi:hypothetical protein
MDKHITLIAVINLVFSILLFCVGMFLFIAVTGGGLISRDPEAIFITGLVGTALAVFFTILSVPGFIGGLGLLKRKSWARILMLIISVLDLFVIPFGTIFGIYTIWVLMQDEAIALFR